MSIRTGRDEAFRTSGRVVIVGASLAGLHAAETLRREGFRGRLTLVGDEPDEPYDRPPLSKQVLAGRCPPESTALPHACALDAEWRLGTPAIGLDRAGRRVRLAGGEEIPFDRLLIATGTRARPWPNPAEAALAGVVALRGRDDTRRLRQELAAGPRRVLVIGAGFTGSEVASVGRELGLPVTVAERAASPLAGALGGAIGAVAARLQREHGVDLRCGVTVTSLEGDARGHVRRAYLDDGSALDADVAVVALGTLRNTEWLRDSGLGAGPRGVACDAGCRVFDMYGIVTDDVFAAGDVARSPHPLFGFEFLALEHWSNAVEQAEVAAHNLLSAETERRPYLHVPTFWSFQFGVGIESAGVPALGEDVVVVQGSTDDRRFVALYGHQGRTVAAVTFDQSKWLDFYLEQIETAAPFPPRYRTVDQPAQRRVVPADFPDPAVPSHGPMVIRTGHSPTERAWTLVPAQG
ncbi:MAG TPA: FAD/NAD(P)-binding oxidoreductase [Candidatus Dormibacteraeota bacterium]|nr:FAD/NAD(P)-binding oxidoreductase [Candidatus Dormibacteraeota bacterium]